MGSIIIFMATVITLNAPLNVAESSNETKKQIAPQTNTQDKNYVLRGGWDHN
ncbi:MAG TPA: hypothetical protein PKN75_08230 [Bacteroidia bacterium]|nr:hypothetical protein [Bacteroidia bacterium]